VPIQEEAFVVTGQQNAEAAARSVLSRPEACTQWCVVKQGANGALLCTKDAEGTITAHPSLGFKLGNSFISA